MRHGATEECHNHASHMIALQPPVHHSCLVSTQAQTCCPAASFACCPAASFVPATLPPPLCLLLCRLLCAYCSAASFVPAALPPPWCLLPCHLLGACCSAASLAPATLPPPWSLLPCSKLRTHSCLGSRSTVARQLPHQDSLFSSCGTASIQQLRIKDPDAPLLPMT